MASPCSSTTVNTIFVGDWMFVEHNDRIAMQCFGVAEQGQLPFGTLCSVIVEDVVVPMAISGLPSATCGSLLPKNLLENARDFAEPMPGVVTCSVTKIAGLDALHDLVAASEEGTVKTSLLPAPVMFGSDTRCTRIEFRGCLEKYSGEEDRPEHRMAWQCDKFVVPYSDVRGVLLPDVYEEVMSRTCFPKIYESMIDESSYRDHWDLACLTEQRNLFVLRYMVDWHMVELLDRPATTFDAGRRWGDAETVLSDLRTLIEPGGVCHFHSMEWVVVE